jgi:phosphoribosyl-ATP pyrophosphohydrolase/phosphoribosyl-AMP cyclohydrolase
MNYYKQNWDNLGVKTDHDLIPAIVQDAETATVLMLGYMNAAAWDQTMESGKVTFFSRSKQRLWTKGEQSGNFMFLADWQLDCDRDTFLLQVRPQGPVCHNGTDTCWGKENHPISFLNELEKVILNRKAHPEDGSYTNKLLEKGIPAMAQKLGEEAVETVIEAMQEDRDRFLNESADLMFHFLVLLAAKNCSLREVEETLKERQKK